MNAAGFLRRRDQAITLVEAGRAQEAEEALRSLIRDCERQGTEGAHWRAIAQSDLAVVAAKLGRREEAEELIRRAHGAARRSHPFAELMVLHNRSVVHDALGDAAESVEWAWQVVEIVRMHESVLPQLGGRTGLDSQFFERGALALHVVVDYYCNVEPDFRHADGFLPEAFHWVDRAIDIDSSRPERTMRLLCEKARLLMLLGHVKMQLGQKEDARRAFLQASTLSGDTGDPTAAANAARLAGMI